MAKLGILLANIATFYPRQSWQSSDITFLIMSKVQTQGKVGKVGDTFGLIWLLFRLGKVGKVKI